MVEAKNLKSEWESAPSPNSELVASLLPGVSTSTKLSRHLLRVVAQGAGQQQPKAGCPGFCFQVL